MVSRALLGERTCIKLLCLKLFLMVAMFMVRTSVVPSVWMVVVVFLLTCRMFPVKFLSSVTYTPMFDVARGVGLKWA